jgi:hypothetical protein
MPKCIWICFFLNDAFKGIGMQYLSGRDWLNWTQCSCFIYDVMSSRISLFYLRPNSIWWYVWYYMFFAHLPIGGHLGCFHVLFMINNAVTNRKSKISLQILVSVILDISLDIGLLGKTGSQVGLYCKMQWFSLYSI